MDIVTLPLVQVDTSTEAALGRLRREARSGLIAEATSNRFWLAFAGDIERARRRGDNLVNVTYQHPVYVADLRDRDRYGIDLDTPSSTWQAYETLLDSVGAEYAVIMHRNGMATIVTRHEHLAYVLSGVVLECDGPDRHVLPQPVRNAGDQCPFCDPALGHKVWPSP